MSLIKIAEAFSLGPDFSGIAPFVNSEFVQNLLLLGLRDEVEIKQVQSVEFVTQITDEEHVLAVKNNPWKAVLFVESETGRVIVHTSYPIPLALAVGIVRYIRMNAEEVNKFHIQSYIRVMLQAQAAKNAAIAVPRSGLVVPR